MGSSSPGPRRKAPTRSRRNAEMLPANLAGSLSEEDNLRLSPVNGQSRRAMSTIPWDREGIPGVSLHGNDPAALPAAIGRVAFETLQASGTRKAEHRIRAAEKSFQAAHSKRPARGRRAKRTLPLGTPFLENWP